MKRTAIAFLISWTLIHPAACQQATRFKGFFVGMSKSAVIAHRPEEYGVKDRQTPHGVLLEKAEDGQSHLPATLELTEEGVVK